LHVALWDAKLYSLALSLTARVGWRCEPALVKCGFQLVNVHTLSHAYITLRTAPHVDAHVVPYPHVHMRQCTVTHGTVGRRTSMEDTADANYMLITVVVNGHNSVAVHHRTTSQCVNAAIEIKALDYVAVRCR